MMYCCHTTGNDYHMRCKANATHRILDSDGWRVPGGIYCEKHAREIVAEYNSKLGWNWTIELIPEEEL